MRRAREAGRGRQRSVSHGNSLDTSMVGIKIGWRITDNLLIGGC
jgi:hypothetical protein